MSNAGFDKLEEIIESLSREVTSTQWNDKHTLDFRIEQGDVHPHQTSSSIVISEGNQIDRIEIRPSPLPEYWPKQHAQIQVEKILKNTNPPTDFDVIIHNEKLGGETYTLIHLRTKRGTVEPGNLANWIERFHKRYSEFYKKDEKTHVEILKRIDEDIEHPKKSKFEKAFGTPIKGYRCKTEGDERLCISCEENKAVVPVRAKVTENSTLHAGYCEDCINEAEHLGFIERLDT